MLKRIVIRNYRSCESTSFECHPQLSVLIGPNSSGKTNVLQAMMFLKKMATPEYAGARHGTANVTSSNLVATFDAEKAKIQGTASIDAYTDDSNNDSIVNATERWRVTYPKNGKKYNSTLPLSFFIERHTDWRVSAQFPLYSNARWRIGRRQLIAEREIVTRAVRMPREVLDSLERVARYCLGMRYYSASQFTNPGACPVSLEVEEEKGTFRRPLRISGHAETLYRMFDAQKKEADRYDRFMDIVGPNGLRLVDRILFKEIRTSSVDVTARVGGKIEKVRRQKLMVVPQFYKGREILSPNQLSEGTFKTLALLFNVITDNSTALLIEEPEVCVHQGLLSSILELIKQYSVTKQMFVSTHSDYVLDYLQPDNVFTVKYDKKTGTQVRHIRKSMTAKEFSALRHYLEHEGNLGDYWREGALENT